MNLVEIAGFLGSDAEERFTSGGKKVITLRLATKARQGKEDVTIWWRVSIWGDRFDKMVPYLKKGTALIVIGEMGKPETYVDKEGKTQVALTLQAEIIRFSPFGKPGKANEASEGMGGFKGDYRGNDYKTSDFKASNMTRESSSLDEMAPFGAMDKEAFTSDDLPF